MSEAAGYAPSTIHRIWRAFRPHRSETFKLDPLFVEKVRDIVGLYLDPPRAGAGASVDEKSQMQALDRTQPLLPMRPGQRRTHDDKRNATTSLFAALDVATGKVIGKVIGKCFHRHRNEEFRKFLNYDNVPPDLDIHIVMDSYATHKTETTGSPSARAGMSTSRRHLLRPGRTLPVDGKTTEAGRPRVDCRPRASHPFLYRYCQQHTVDQIGGRNSSLDPAVLLANAGNCQKYELRDQDIRDRPWRRRTCFQ